ncbi:RICIN domain-containing protein [Micromonospora sp. KC213]|uniref:RICIN domain-containing protein n=1 Tax=Micromonospora sp. KC213 TaxID=2530378 RepID=UPI001053D1EF|nr:RICIN domain-containing protein [Micromonospora sp. KC213]TDC41666.1 hypothetical protein E1166_10720 [Micromonospora sp. KC213]
MKKIIAPVMVALGVVLALSAPASASNVERPATGASGAGLAPAPAGVSVAAPITATLTAPAESGFVVEPAGVGALAAVSIRNRATNRCLEQALGGSTGHVFTAPCNGGTKQLWYWGAGSGTWTYLINSWSSECLDGTESTGRVYTLACNGGRYQQWQKDSFTGRINHRNEINHYSALDSNWQGSVYLNSPNAGDYQKWS